MRTNTHLPPAQMGKLCVLGQVAVVTSHSCFIPIQDGKKYYFTTIAR